MSFLRLFFVGCFIVIINSCSHCSSDLPQPQEPTVTEPTTEAAPAPEMKASDLQSAPVDNAEVK